jgi:hypothetical protein
MKIEIIMLETPGEEGIILDIVDCDFRLQRNVENVAVSAMVKAARDKFGSGNFEAVLDQTIFGGYYRHKSDGRCIIAR